MTTMLTSQGPQLTEQAYGELAAGLAGTPRSCLLAEIGAALRIAGTVRLRGGTPAVEASFSTYPQAARLRAAITAVAGYRPPVRVVYPDGPGQPGSRQSAAPRYLLDVGSGQEAANLLRTAGLAVRPLAGMPRPVVAGNRQDCEAGWRGAFLAAGALCSPERVRPTLTVACPTTETALALAGLASRFGVLAQTREYRGLHQALIVGADHITSLLAAIGAPATAARWQASREDFQVAGPALHGLGNLDGSNLNRSKTAAAESTARTRRALEILGADVPGHLQLAARLRTENPEASLGQLALMATPTLTKDRMRGLLRRLFEIANERASGLGISGTEEAVLALAQAS